jgi:hypothetical protein
LAIYNHPPLRGVGRYMAKTVNSLVLECYHIRNNDISLSERRDDNTGNRNNDISLSERRDDNTSNRNNDISLSERREDNTDNRNDNSLSERRALNVRYSENQYDYGSHDDANMSDIGPTRRSVALPHLQVIRHVLPCHVTMATITQ